ncbi:hypothetical protein GGP76_000885, partial [Salinibacter ruber]|nr:hypothetical protein [Salinibacter ruber]
PPGGLGRWRRGPPPGAGPPPPPPPPPPAPPPPPPPVAGSFRHIRLGRAQPLWGCKMSSTPWRGSSCGRPWPLIRRSGGSMPVLFLPAGALAGAPEHVRSGLRERPGCPTGLRGHTSSYQMGGVPTSPRLANVSDVLSTANSAEGAPEARRWRKGGIPQAVRQTPRTCSNGGGVLWGRAKGNSVSTVISYRHRSASRGSCARRRGDVFSASIEEACGQLRRRLTGGGTGY